MRQRMLLGVVLVAMAMVAAPVVADIPDWDWQATFIFDSNGDVNSHTLDYSSDDWIDCANVWVTTHDTSDTTTNMTHAEIVRIDTVNHLRGHWRQENGYVNDTWEFCLTGTQIGLPELVTANNKCYISGAYGGCMFSCTEGQTIYVDVDAGYTPFEQAELRGNCGGTDPQGNYAHAECHPDPVELTCGDTSEIGAVADQTPLADNCRTSSIGIWAVAACGAEDS